jgi:hypothetical protein
VATLAGMGAGGALGGTTGALIGFGMPEYQAKRYEGRMRKGGILLSVHADDQEWAQKGKRILEETGAEDISSTTETKGDFRSSSIAARMAAEKTPRIPPPSSERTWNRSGTRDTCAADCSKDRSFIGTWRAAAARRGLSLPSLFLDHAEQLRPFLEYPLHDAEDPEV